MPALSGLELLGGRVAVQASRRAPQLQRLVNSAEHLAVDFAALPGLVSATLAAFCQLQRPASIAAATSLTYLSLRTHGYPCDPSALEMLRSLPPVSCLTMDKGWPQQAVDLVGNMTSLVGLELRYGGGAPWPADDAPVWAGLRAFKGSWLPRDNERGDVPKALRRASKLEVLQLALDDFTIQDMDFLTSLPALRKLAGGCRKQSGCDCLGPPRLGVLENRHGAGTSLAAAAQPAVLHELSASEEKRSAYKIINPGLTSLDWKPPGRLHVADALPRAFAARFPSLRQLDLRRLVVASTWLCGLSSLGALRTLSLGFEGLTDAATASATVRFPSLPSLAHLIVSVWPGPSWLQLQLDDLPALTELKLPGPAGGAVRGRVAVQASQPVPKLQRLSSYAAQLAVDFAALPCLKSATFSASCQFEHPASIAAATALTYLSLDGHILDGWRPSALELLRSLPTSVRCISMDGEWPREAADLLGDMTSLVGLEMYQEEPWPADDAPVWAGLRAFGCCLLDIDVRRGDLLKGLRQSSKLEVLQVHWDEPTIQFMDVITSLPALRRLSMQYWERKEDSVTNAWLNVSRRTMPQVEILLNDFLRCEEFFKLMRSPEE
ncbi:hypothetical protein N2152v2_000971 [Parachlorella kessleri]